MWNIWVNDRFRVHPKIEAGYAFRWFSNLGTTRRSRLWAACLPTGAVGALYNLAVD